MADGGGIVELPDGSRVRVRVVDRTDRDALLAGFERLSPQSRFLRFFTGIGQLTGSILEHLTNIDNENHVAIGVFDPDRPSDVGSDDGLGIGVGRYFRSADDPTRADASIAIIDEYHGKGIGTVLLNSLIVFARERGIETFTFDVLAENRGMAAILKHLGAVRDQSIKDFTELRFEVAVPEASIPIEKTASYRVMKELAASD